MTKNEYDPIFNLGTKEACSVLFAVLAQSFFVCYMMKMQITIPITMSLENEKMKFLRLSKEQLTHVKSAMKSLNSTLLTVSDKKILSKGLEDMAKNINLLAPELFF